MPRLRGQISRLREAAFGLPLAFVVSLAAQLPAAGEPGAHENGAHENGPTVRVAAPVTGSHARSGNDLRRGARRAVAAINATGGIAGRQVAMETRALACGTGPAVEPRSSDRQAPTLVIVPPCAAAAIEASPAVTVLVVAGSADGITAAQLPPKVPRLPASAPAQGETATRFALARRGSGPFVIVSDGTRYSRAWAAQVRAALRAANAAAPIELELTAGARDYSALGRSIAQAHPAVVFLGAFPAEAAIVVDHLEDAHVASLLIGMDVLGTETFLDLARERAGRIFIPVAASVQFPPGTPPVRGAEVFAYAGVEAWAQAIAAQPDTPVSETWRTRSATTIAGSFRFTDDGEPTLPAFVMSRWIGGRLQPVEGNGAQ